MQIMNKQSYMKINFLNVHDKNPYLCIGQSVSSQEAGVRKHGRGGGGCIDLCQCMGVHQSQI